MRLPTTRFLTRLLTTTLLLVLSAPSVARSQGEILELRPGDPALDGTRIAPFVATYQVWVEEDGERLRAETWTRTVAHVRTAAGPAIDEIWHLHFEQMTIYDQSIYLRQSFAPVMKRILSHRGNDIVDFGGERPRYTFVPLVDSEEEAGGFEFGLDGPRFAGGDNFALATLDLEPGDRVRMLSVAADPGMVGESLAAESVVLDRETVEMPTGETFDALRVRGGAADAEFWLADRPPYVVRRRFGNRTWELTGYVKLPGIE